MNGGLHLVGMFFSVSLGQGGVWDTTLGALEDDIFFFR
jgi:hypothetical protein